MYQRKLAGGAGVLGSPAPARTLALRGQSKRNRYSDGFGRLTSPSPLAKVSRTSTRHGLDALRGSLDLVSSATYCGSKRSTVSAAPGAREAGATSPPEH